MEHARRNAAVIRNPLIDTSRVCAGTATALGQGSPEGHCLFERSIKGCWVRSAGALGISEAKSTGRELVSLGLKVEPLTSFLPHMQRIFASLIHSRRS
jgi:hypothetical protein